MKTLRKFNSIEEFFAVTGFKIGDIVKIKNFFGNETALITGFRVYTDPEFREIDVLFSGSLCSLTELFMHYEYYKNGQWLRFAVEE